MLFRLSVRENEVLTEKDEDFIFFKRHQKNADNINVDEARTNADEV